MLRVLHPVFIGGNTKKVEKGGPGADTEAGNAGDAPSSPCVTDCGWRGGEAVAASQPGSLDYAGGIAVRAPTLPTDAAWLNVERALEPGDLLGRVVLLDFWTYA
jgi:hypothetical protein